MTEKSEMEEGRDTGQGLALLSLSLRLSRAFAVVHGTGSLLLYSEERTVHERGNAPCNLLGVTHLGIFKLSTEAVLTRSGVVRNKSRLLLFPFETFNVSIMLHVAGSSLA